MVFGTTGGMTDLPSGNPRPSRVVTIVPSGFRICTNEIPSPPPNGGGAWRGPPPDCWSSSIRAAPACPAVRDESTRVKRHERSDVYVGTAATASHFVPRLVEHEIGEPEQVAREVSSGAAQDRLDPSHDLREAERLRDVVVASGAQRLDLVLGAVARGEEEHGALEAARAQPAADLDALDVRQHPVEHDQIRLAPNDRIDRVTSAVRLLD